jgi:hypothetical protein
MPAALALPCWQVHGIFAFMVGVISIVVYVSWNDINVVSISHLESL